MIDDIIASGFPPELIVVLVSTLPVAELRAGVPMGMNLFHMSWYVALGLSIIGNLIPVPFLLLFWKGVAKAISRTTIGARFVNWLFRRAERYKASTDKYGFQGLMLFVAIPLPGAGAWTGSTAAWVMGLKFWRAFLSICFGVIIDGFIIVGLSLLGWLGLAIGVIALIVLALVGWWRF